MMSLLPTLALAVPLIFSPYAAEPTYIEPNAQRQPLTHAQEVWLSALEWCESRGNPSAINKVDRDGTPSYYSYQFKPGTFKMFGEYYGVIPTNLPTNDLMELMKRHDLQREIVRHMIKDPDTRWSQQFPACTKLLGTPPEY